MEERRKHKKWRQDKQPDQVSFIECRVMPYIGGQEKRLGQCSDGGWVFSNYYRVCAMGLYFSRTLDRACALGCIFSWAGKYLRAHGKSWCAREQFWRAREKLRRGRENLWARAGRVCKERTRECALLSPLCGDQQQRSANSRPHGSG